MMAVLPMPIAAVAQQAAPVTLGAVRQARDEATARALAPRVLPPAIATSVVTGIARRRFLPGQVWWLGFRDAPRAVAPDLCERAGYSVEASAGPDAAEDAPDDTPLTLGPQDRWTEIAVLPRGRRATAARCADAAFVSVRRERDRVVAAYRVLVAAMGAAAGKARLPFVVTCEGGAPAACRDARQALATLPFSALSAIEVSCLAEDKRREERGGVSILSCPAIGMGRPYRAEVWFGMSAPDGQSWRVDFIHRSGWPATIALSRAQVTYH